ncbi:hypothetical protein HanPI659440_Chr04g0148631 [Helianthus annuus]|nr:hypothetical protein HanPI659440_Chr04g0148631 [Helianthus annuus]
MDEYLQHMKTLRSHMNDVEDQAAKISVEEQMQITTIQTLTKEIDSGLCYYSIMRTLVVFMLNCS